MKFSDGIRLMKCFCLLFSCTRDCQHTSAAFGNRLDVLSVKFRIRWGLLLLDLPPASLSCQPFNKSRHRSRATLCCPSGLIDAIPRLTGHCPSKATLRWPNFEALGEPVYRARRQQLLQIERDIVKALDGKQLQCRTANVEQQSPINGG